MTSSLAAQLATIGTVDRDRLQAATSKFRPSFLFPPRQAASLSNEEIHSLAYNGYLALLAQDSRFERFDSPIFGEKAKVTDRTILTKEDTAKLDDVLSSLIRLLASKFLLKSTGKVLEWLIRRFRINDFNVEELVRMILPYHETPQFVQMLQIIKLDAKFQAFEAVKKSLQPMPRHHLLTAMSKSPELFRFVGTAVEPYRMDGCLYSTLIAFWTGSVLAYMEKVKNLQPQDMSIILPVIVHGIKSDNQDLRLGNYIILSHLVVRTELSQETAMLLAESTLSSIKASSESDEQEAALTTLAILCGHQDPPLPPFSAKAALLPTPVFHVLLSLAQRSNVTALLQSLLPTLLGIAQQQHIVADLLHNLLAPPTCPLQVTQVAARIILDSCTVQGTIPSGFLKLLEAIEQRLPEKTSLLSFASQPRDSRLTQLLEEQLGKSKDAPSNSSSVGGALNHRDAALRASRLGQVLESLLKDGETVSDVQQMQEVILDALSDSSVDVATVLFDAKYTPILARFSTSRTNEVFQRCLQRRGRTTEDKIVILQAGFLMQTFADSASGDWRVRVLTDFLWPHLLASKHSLPKVNAIWKIVVELDKTKWPFFNGAQDHTVRTEEEAAAFNEALVDMLSKEALVPTATQSKFSEVLDATALQENSASDPEISTLSQLIILKLLAQGDCRFAQVILERPFITTASEAVSQYGSSHLPHGLARRIWLKPNSSKTHRALGSARLCTAMHAVAASKSTATWSWLAAPADLEEATIQHRSILTKIYELLHSASIYDESRKTIMEVLITKQLQPDFLAFLAGIYTSDRADVLRVIALNEAAAFITHQNDLDYQVIVPSLIQVLSRSKPAVCQAALRVLSHMRDVSVGPKSRVYGFDAFYGKFSDKLQYLDKTQYSLLIDAILEEEASLLVDGSYIQNSLSRVLDATRSDGKRLTRQALLAFITSHAEAWRQISARIALFTSIQLSMDEKRSNLFLPFLAEGSEVNHAMFASDAVQNRTYWKIVLKGLKTRQLSEDLLRSAIGILQGARMDPLAMTLRDELRGALQSWLLSAATAQQRSDLYSIASLLVQDNVNGEAARNLEVLRSCLGYADVLQAGIAGVREAIMHRALDAQSAKKAKSGRAANQDVELARLALLLENANFTPSTASLELLASFLSLLAALVDLSTSYNDIDYYVQLATTRASEIAAGLPIPDDDADLRVGPVLETIRISSNPATSNAALNLMAELARLAPAQVAQNVMPIFTFMGTNVMQRDDAQSTRIVDKTIRTIVPALVYQRRQRSLSKEQMLLDMEEVLRVFVDAATHVPRHRRLHLFIRFVEILGPQDFLAPVCTLMVDKVAARFMKTRDVSMFSLPLGVYHHFTGSIQLNAVHEHLLDLHTKVDLLNSDVVEESVSSRHSSPVTPAESPLLPVKSSRRTVLALLYFLQEVLSSKRLTAELQRARSTPDASPQRRLAEIMEAAVQLMGIEVNKLSQTDTAQLCACSQSLVKLLSRLMSTSEFVTNVKSLIGSSASEVSDLGIDMLVDRVSGAKPVHRQVLLPAISASLLRLSDVLMKSDSKSKRLHALLRIRAVAIYCAEEDMSRLYQALTSVLSLMEKNTSTTFNYQALTLITEVVPNLGGRIIPAVHRLLAITNTLIRQHLPSSSVAVSRNIVSTGFSVLEILLQHTPTFVAKEIKTVLDLCVGVESSQAGTTEAKSILATSADKVISTCTRKLSPQALFQALQELYSQKLSTAAAAAPAVVTMIARTIRQTSTRTVAEMHKTLFVQLLAIFDARSQLNHQTKIVDEIERAGVGAFMQFVLKLNEATFRPLFMRLVDWITPESSGDMGVQEAARRFTFFQVLDRLLAQLKGIALPYYSLAFDITLVTLQAESEEKLWQTVLSVLRRALDTDVASFWTEARLAKLVIPLANQSRRPFLNRPTLVEAFQTTIKTFTNVSTAHYHVLQTLHKQLLLLAREDNEVIQLNAIRALQAMWDSDAQPDLIAFKPESMPAIAELLEAGGQIEQETKILLATMAEGEEDADMAADEEDSEAGEGEVEYEDGDSE